MKGFYQTRTHTDALVHGKEAVRDQRRMEDEDFRVKSEQSKARVPPKSADFMASWTYSDSLKLLSLSKDYNCTRRSCCSSNSARSYLSMYDHSPS